MIDTARKIRDIDKDVVLMFVTAMPQYALSGYEVAIIILPRLKNIIPVKKACSK